MIRDAHQLLITRQQRQLLADALHDLGASSDPITELQRASLEGQIADLDNQVADYERTHPSSE